jgi:cytoskeletal protein CcmA (bactofilin family)
VQPNDPIHKINVNTGDEHIADNQTSQNSEGQFVVPVSHEVPTPPQVIDSQFDHPAAEPNVDMPFLIPVVHHNAAPDDVVSNFTAPEEPKPIEPVQLSPDVPVEATQPSAPVEEVVTRPAEPIAFSPTLQSLPSVNTFPVASQETRRDFRTPLIVVIILLLLIGGWFVWNARFRQPAGLQPTSLTPQQINQLTPTTTLPSTGKLSVSGDAVISGNLSVEKDVNVTGNVSAGGTITANQFVGDGSGLTNVSCPSCVKLQATLTGASQTGNIDITGAVLAGSFSGDGSDLENVDAITLAGQNQAFYLNATNLNAGTLSDARLSANVALLDIAQTFTGDKTFAGAAIFQGSVSSSQVITQNGSIVCDISNNCGYSIGAGSAFVQDGNSFGGLATLGTNDAFGLAFETGGAERIRIDTTGNVGIGTITPSAGLHVQGTSSQLRIGYDGSNYLNLTTDSTGSTVARAVGSGSLIPLMFVNDGGQDFYLRSYGGSTNYVGQRAGGTEALPTATANGNILTALVGGGYDGTAFANKGRIAVVAAGTWSGTSHPTQLTLSVTPVGSTTMGEVVRITSAGNVGIGDTTPAALLTVGNGDLFQVSSAGLVSYINGATDTSTYVCKNAAGQLAACSTTGAAGPAFIQGGNSFGQAGVLGTNDAFDLQFETGNSIKMTIQNSTGNVGIGTTSPQAKLHVTGSSVGILVTAEASPDVPRVTLEGYTRTPNIVGKYANGTAATPTAATLDNTLLQLRADGYGATAFQAGSASINLRAAQTWTDLASGSYINFFTTTNGQTSPAERLRISDSGNVGIGTTTPTTFKLEVAGNIGPEADNTRDLGSSGRRWANVYATNIQGAITPTGFTQGSVTFAGTGGTLNQDNGNFFWDDTNNRLGIGTNAPTQIFHVIAPTASTAALFQINSTGSQSAIRLYNTDTTDNNTANIFFSSDTSGAGASAEIALAQIRGIFTTHDHATRSGAIAIHTVNAGGASTERLRVASDGNVGIGTTAPGNKLSVHTTTGLGLEVARYTTAAGSSPGIQISKSNTDTLDAFALHTSADTEIGKIIFSPATSSAFRTTAGIFAFTGVGGHQSNTDMPTYLTINTTPDGSGNPIERLRIAESGNVGIGTTSPGALLHVQAAAVASTAETVAQFDVADDATARIRFNNASSTDALFIPRVDFTGSGASIAGILRGNITTDTGTSPVLAFDARLAAGGAVTTRPLFDFRNNGTSQVLIDAAGKLGIGDTDPLYMLTVGSGDLFGVTNTGDLVFEGSSADANELTITVANPTADRTYTIPNSSAATDTFCLLTLGNCFGAGTGNTLQAAYDAGNTISSAAYSAGRNIDITLADTATDSLVRITQAGAANALEVHDDGTFADTTPFVIDSSGNVGIKTASAASALHVAGAGQFGTAGGTEGTLNVYRSTATPTAVFLTLANYDATDGNGSLLRFSSLTTGAGAQERALAYVRSTTTDHNDATRKGNLLFDTSNGAGPATQLFVRYDGNIGIGTTTPTNAHLEITRSTNGEEGIWVTNANAGTATYSILRTQNSTATANDGAFLLATGTGFTTTGAYKQDGGAVGADAQLAGGLSVVAAHASGDLRFYTGGSANGNQRLTVLSGGNVGIGDTTPAALLTVGNGDLFQVSSAGLVTYVDGTTNTSTYVCKNASGQLAACNTTGTGAAFIQDGNSFGAAATLGTNDAFDLNIETGGTTKLTVQNSTGNVIIGATGTGILQVGTVGDGGGGPATVASRLDVYHNAGDANAVNGNFILVAEPTASTASTYRSLIGDARTDSGNSQNLTTTFQGLQGVTGFARHQGSGTVTTASAVTGQIQNTGTGHITTATGVRAGISNSGTAGATITDAAAFRAGSPTATITTAPITNAYGLYIDLQKSSTGVGTGYGIYQAGATDINYFAGNVGVGDSTPTEAKLVVLGASTGDALYVSNDSSTGNIATFNDNTTPVLVIADGGNTGIGDSSPTEGRLSVGANGAANETITVKSQLISGIELLGDTDNDAGELGTAYVLLGQDSNAATGYSIFGTVQFAGQDSKGTAYTGTIANSTLLAAGEAGDLHLGTNDNVRLTIDNTGRVGIGDTTPDASLQITGGSGNLLHLQRVGPNVDLTFSGVNGDANFIMNDASQSWIQGVDVSDSSRFKIDAGTAVTGGAAITIDPSTRNVGFGTALAGSINAKISLANDLTAQKLLLYDSGNTRYGFGIQSAELRMFAGTGGVMTFGHVSSTDGSTFTERMRMDIGGNLGIGDASPDARLDVEPTGAVTATSYAQRIENLQTNATTDAIDKYGLHITSTGTFTGGAGTATNNYGLFVATPTGGDNNYAAIFQGGNVGIGDTTPDAGLEVSGTQGLVRVNWTDTAQYGQLLFTEADSLSQGGGIQSVGSTFATANRRGDIEIFNSTSGGDITFGLVGTGKVGIGDSDPASLFTVGAGDLFQVNSSGAIVAAVGISGVSGNITPEAAGTRDLGSTTLEFDELFVADDGGIKFGLDQDADLAYDETTDDRVELTGTGASLFIEDKLALGVQTLTLTDDGTANDTLTPTATYVRIDADETANGGVPDLVISETGAKDGQLLIILNNEQDGSNDTFTLTNSAGVLQLGATTVTVGPNDGGIFIYMNDRWVTLGSQNNL